MNHAKDLRRNQTEAEKKLWYALRDRRFENWKFRRQVPVGNFIADFVCYDAMLIVEVDGGQHADSTGDVSRTLWLEKAGFKVERFWNNEVLENIDGVLQQLNQVLKSRPPHPARPLRPGPPSPTRGEGNGENQHHD